MSKKQQRKSLNKNNYKIEALGPRWMMDAYVDYDDFVNEISAMGMFIPNQVQQHTQARHFIQKIMETILNLLVFQYGAQKITRYKFLL